MSADDIVFEEVAYRQPHRVRRPDRDRNWACMAYEVPGPEDLPIFLDRCAADKIERHALSDTTVELGGILLGQECVDDATGLPFVWITEALEAKHFENTQASFTYTHDSWQAITRERDEKFPKLDIVGWYHTHPDYGIFLSGHDLFIQEHFFAQPLQVAYVVDPINQTRGFFQWQGEALRQVGGFFLTAERADRIALARLVNDLEHLPNLEGGGFTLSPRLEAELIAMLTRPHQTSAPPDRGVTAAVFSLLGIFVGALGLALALWIYALTGQVREQTQTLNSLRTELARAEDDRFTERRLDRLQAKEEALDALLREVRLGSGQEQFLSMYEQAIAERNAAVRQAAIAEEIENRLLDQKRELEQLQATVSAQNVILAEYSKEKRELEDLRDQQQTFVKAADRLANLERLEADENLPRKYDWAWYAALTGWGACLLLGLAFVAVLARLLPGSESQSESNGPETPEHPFEEPPHPIR